MYSYTSNPTLKDSDYDGIDDNLDPYPLDNTFDANLVYDGLTCKVSFQVDYRDIVAGDNTTYNKNLAVLTSLLSSNVYHGSYLDVTRGVTSQANNGRDKDAAQTFGTMFGLESSEYYQIKGSDYSYDRDDVTDFTIGHRKVTYNGKTTDVIVLAVRGTGSSNGEWSSNFDVGADTNSYANIEGMNNRSHPYWKNLNNHKGFDVTANRIKEIVDKYLSEHVDQSSNIDRKILITGHSRGGAIANILGAEFEDDPNYTSFTYTFAAPNTTTSSNASSYSSIFNIVNSDDMIPQLPLSSWRFTKYGTTKQCSVFSKYAVFGGSGYRMMNANTYEALTKRSYNCDSFTQSTLNYLAKTSNTRADLYQIDYSSDGETSDDWFGHYWRSGANSDLVKKRGELDSEKLSRFCLTYVRDPGWGLPYQCTIRHSPAYLMQSLANMITGVGPKLGHGTDGKYFKAKMAFVRSSGKLWVVGGMTDPHRTASYYLIVRNDFKSID